MNFTISRKNKIIWGRLLAAVVIIGIISSLIIGCIAGFKIGIGEAILMGFYIPTVIIIVPAIVFYYIVPYVKRFILYVCRKVIDFVTTLDLIIGLIILVAGIDNSIDYGWFVLGALLYIIITVLKNYAMYLLIDIRDSLHKLAYGEDAEATTKKAPVASVAEDMKQCPKCGQMIKQSAKKCRYCGEWINEESKGDE